jgi:hypothetical protein
VSATDIAERYSACDLRCLPVRARGKVPLIADWPQRATSDAAQISAWIDDGANLGVALGAWHGRWLVVLDIDRHHGGADGIDSLVELEARHGDMPPTWEAESPGGGLHRWFAINCEIRNSSLAPGIDIRGAGGQVVVEPSEHPNGGRYEWAPGHAPWEREIAEAPEWLAEMLAPPPAVEPTRERRRAPLLEPINGARLGDRPGDRFEAATTWADLLHADGWTEGGTGPGGETRWTRPGKDPRQGCSATTGYRGADVLKVFTSSVPWFDANATYSRFGYVAARDFGGDYGAAASALVAAGFGAPDFDPIAWIARDDDGGVASAVVASGERSADDDTAHLVDWSELFTREPAEHQWVIEPLIPAGRAIALWAPAKAGKSAVLMAALMAACSGRSVLGAPPTDPVDVLYLDYEMTADDLCERAAELGYGPADADALSDHLHYALLPSFEPLDTAAGGRQVLDLASRLGVALVVVDTFGRAIDGEEDKADTIRAFYRHTGSRLKSAGVALCRTDHAGKAVDRGQRGSSAKADDVDVVWRLARTDGGAVLTRTHSRIGWVPETVSLTRSEAEDGGVEWRLARSWVPAGTAAAVELLDRLEVPIGATRTQARQILANADAKIRNDVLGAALRSRVDRAAVDWVAGDDD